MNPPRTIGVPSPLGNPVLASTQSPTPTTVVGSQLPAQFQVTNNHHQKGPALSQTVAQQAQAQAAYAQFQGQLQSQAAAQQSHHIRRTQNTPAAAAANASPSPAPPNVPTPPSGSGSVRRAQQRPPNKTSGSSNASTGSLMKTMELAPAPRKKKRKVQEVMKIPDNVSSFLPECELYTRLLKLEKRMDCDLLRKKMDMHEYLRNPPHVRKTLRIYVFNTCDNQNQMDVDGDEGKAAAGTAPPTWTLKIIGKILEDGVDDTSTSTSTLGDWKYPKFSSFFKRITVSLDQTLYPGHDVITWTEKDKSRSGHEGFEVKRKGNKEFTANIKLEMNYTPERFKLSPTLAQVLGMEVETKPKVLNALWQYIKTKKLQDLNDPSYFACDAPLRKVFFDEKVRFAVASLKLSQHLNPLQHIHIRHEIKLDGGSDTPSGSTCYDVTVDVPFPCVGDDMSSLLTSMEDQKEEIDEYDRTIVGAIKKIREHSKRRAFFLGFSQSPAEFINVLIGSQNRDLKAFAGGDASSNAEKEQSSEFFNQAWIEDAVIQYLNRKPSMMGGANTGRSSAQK